MTSEILYADAADPRGEFTVDPAAPRLVEYSAEHAVVGGEDRFLILHNDGAVNFTLVDAPVSDPTAFRPSSSIATTSGSTRWTRSTASSW